MMMLRCQVAAVPNHQFAYHQYQVFAATAVCLDDRRLVAWKLDCCCLPESRSAQKDFLLDALPFALPQRVLPMGPPQWLMAEGPRVSELLLQSYRPAKIATRMGLDGS